MKPVLFVLFVLSLPLAAQELRVSGPGPGEQPYGERMLVELRLEGADAAARLGALPQVDGLRISAGPARDADGARSWTLSVEALHPGRFMLPAIAVDTGAVTLKSDVRELLVTEQPQGEEELQVILEALPSRVHVGQTLTFRIRLRYRSEFFRDRALQIFGRRLGLPVMLGVPFWEGVEGLEALPLETAGALTLVVEDQMIRGLLGSRAADGRVELLLERRFRALAAGSLRLPPVTARFDHATRFEDDFLEGRRPLDRLRGRVYSNALDLELLEPPIEGRPPRFGGAVGSFEIAMRTDARAVLQGETFTLELLLRGEGNLDVLSEPRLEEDLGLRGLHVFGSRELQRPAPDVRLFRYDVALVDPDLGGVSGAEFAYFDPAEDGGYRLARSEPIPLAVTPRPGFAPPSVPARRELKSGVDDIYGPHLDRVAAVAGPNRVSDSLLWFTLTLPLVVALALFFWLRAHDRDLANPGAARARRARAGLHRALRGSTVPRDLILADYLAARLGRSAPALVRHDLAQELETAGLDAALAGEAARMHLLLIDRRYGPETGELPQDETIRDLAGRIEAHLGAPEIGS